MQKNQLNKLRMKLSGKPVDVASFNLSSESLIVTPLEYGLHHSFIDKSK